MFQPARWAFMASMLLAACAGVPGRGAPDRYAQSFDSATSACRQNPALCAQVAGGEPWYHRPRDGSPRLEPRSPRSGWH